MTTKSSSVPIFTKMDYFDLINYQPHSGQREVHESTARFKVLCCGRRWGKSVCGAKEVEPLILQEDTIGWIVGPEYKTTEKEFREIYRSLIKTQGHKAIKESYNVESGQMSLTFPWSQMQKVPSITCKSERYPSSLVGEGLDWIICCEAAKMKPETWEQYLRPALADKRGVAFFSTTPEGDNWFKGLYEEASHRKDWESFHYPSWTNNIVFPGGRQDEEILALEQDLTVEMFKQEVEGSFTHFTGQVFKEFEHEVHVIEYKYDSRRPTYVFLDFGVANPCAILWVQLVQDDPNRGPYLVIFDEFITTGLSSKQVAEVVKRYSPISMVFCDPSGEQRTVTSGTSIIQDLRNQKLRVIGPRARIVDGLNCVHVFLGQNSGVPLLFLNKFSTMHTQIAFKNYRYPERRQEQGPIAENPYKDGIHEHPMDAIRYGCLGLQALIEGRRSGKISARTT